MTRPSIGGQGGPSRVPASGHDAAFGATIVAGRADREDHPELIRPLPTRHQAEILMPFLSHGRRPRPSHRGIMDRQELRARAASEEEVEIVRGLGFDRFRGSGLGRALLASALVLSLAVLPSCSKKPDTETTYDETTTGVSEGPVSGSSLDQFKKGTLGAGQQGPLQDVHFGYDSYELSDNARELLRINADWLRENPDAKVEVEGHTDSRGTVEYNLALGAKRATAARDYLVSLGISASRITTISYGKELPLCQEESESCWAENRRAHFVVLS
jgi:peptidoglycan-associated lipoprotein